MECILVGQAMDDRYLRLTGGTTTGPIKVSGGDGEISLTSSGSSQSVIFSDPILGGAAISNSGGTLFFSTDTGFSMSCGSNSLNVTGNVSSTKAPTQGTHLTTKTYVDNGLNGKANSDHSHSTNDITSGTLSANRGGTGQTTLTPAVGTKGVRQIYAGTSDMTAGVTALTTGCIYLVYE